MVSSVIVISDCGWCGVELGRKTGLTLRGTDGVADTVFSYDRVTKPNLTHNRGTQSSAVGNRSKAF